MAKTMLTAAAAVALTAVLAVPAVAQDPQGRGGGRGQGMGLGPGRGPGGPGGPGMMLLGRLQLTDAQREQIRAIHQEARADREPQKVMELQRELRLAMLGDTPDQAKIAGLKQAILAAQADGLNHRIEVQSRVFQVLTPEQRTQLREQVSSGPRGPRRAAARGMSRR